MKLEHKTAFITGGTGGTGGNSGIGAPAGAPIYRA
jgi:hypothetical protein